MQAIVFFSGQTVINNIDIVLVKHFFPPAEAGFYAAVALVGRLVNMCAWSVVNTMFPVSAGAGEDEQEGRPVLMTSLLLVFGILSVLVFGLWLVPSFLWKILFGAQFGLGNYGALAPLLILYAVTTGVYSLSSVIITYEMSRKIANTSWLQLVFGGALALGNLTPSSHPAPGNSRPAGLVMVVASGAVSDYSPAAVGGQHIRRSWSSSSEL